MSAGFPGVFPGGLTTGYTNIGAVRKLRNSFGYPGIFPGGLSTGYISIGAVQKADPASGTLAASETGADTFAGTGKITVQGTLAATETGSDTCSMTGTVSGGSVVVAPQRTAGGKGPKHAKGHPRRFVSESIGVLRIVLQPMAFTASGTVVNPAAIVAPTIAASPELLREVIAGAPIADKSVQTIADEIISSLLAEQDPADPNALSAFVTSIPVPPAADVPLFPNDALRMLPPSAIPDQRALKLKKRRREEEAILIALIQSLED